jgi:hypothetical protein
MRLLGCVLLAALVCGLCGCGGPVQSPLGKRSVIKGKVSAAGQALTKGTVVFTPVEAGKGDEQSREISAAGEYIASLFPGKYKVSVPDNTAVPATARAAATTTNELEVPAGDKEGLDINLK